MTGRAMTTRDDMAWRASAACATADPRLFTPSPGKSADRAKAVCRSCPVLVDCLFWALRNPKAAGTSVWGATTFTERTALRAWDRQARPSTSRPRSPNVSRKLSHAVTPVPATVEARANRREAAS